MNGVHDIGGMDNLGPVIVEAEEPVFHSEWESRVFATAIALIGNRYFNLDEVRHTVEWMPPVDYLTASYYETWLHGILTLMQQRGFLSENKLQETITYRAADAPQAALPKDMALYVLNNNIPSSLDLDIKAKFKTGERVISRNIHPRHHTRLPRYVRGKRGVVEQDHGIFLLPDTNAHGGPDRPQHVYSVSFSACELWGEDADEGDKLYIDLHEDYIEASPDSVKG